MRSAERPDALWLSLLPARPRQGPGHRWFLLLVLAWRRAPQRPVTTRAGGQVDLVSAAPWLNTAASWRGPAARLSNAPRGGAMTALRGLPRRHLAVQSPRHPASRRPRTAARAGTHSRSALPIELRGSPLPGRRRPRRGWSPSDVEVVAAPGPASGPRRTEQRALRREPPPQERRGHPRRGPAPLEEHRRPLRRRTPRRLRRPPQHRYHRRPRGRPVGPETTDVDAASAARSAAQAPAGPPPAASSSVSISSTACAPSQ